MKVIEYFNYKHKEKQNILNNIHIINPQIKMSSKISKSPSTYRVSDTITLIIIFFKKFLKSISFA